MVSVILKIVLGEKIIFAKKKKFILNTPIFRQYCGITLPLKAIDDIKGKENGHTIPYILKFITIDGRGSHLGHVNRII